MQNTTLPAKNLAADAEPGMLSEGHGGGNLAKLAKRPLTKAETRTLARREKNIAKHIERSWRSFVEIGVDLSAIREGRLYRETHSTFEAYCQERWDVGRNYVNKQIAASRVVCALGTTVPILPVTERQARPLTAIPSEEISDCWEEVIERADKDDDGHPSITANLVQDVINFWKATKEKYVALDDDNEGENDEGQPAQPAPLDDEAKLAESLAEANNNQGEDEHDDPPAEAPPQSPKSSPKHRSFADRSGDWLGSIVGFSEAIKRPHGSIEELLEDKSWTPSEKQMTLGCVRENLSFLVEFEEVLANQVEGNAGDEADLQGGGGEEDRTPSELVRDILKDVDSLIGHLEKSGRTSDFQVERAVNWLKKVRTYVSEGCEFLV